MNPFRSIFPASNSAPSQTDASRTAVPVPARAAKDTIVELLKIEGCRPKVDSDGDIVFEYKELKYVLLFSSKDSEFVRLVLPNFWRIDSEANRSTAYAAANIANAACKVAKVYVDGEQTHAAAECFVSAHEHITAVLLRSAGALEHAVKSFGIACMLQRGR